MSESTSVLDPVTRLTKDLKAASITLSKQEARFLVDYYYQIQNFRISCEHQIRSAERTGDTAKENEKEPHEVLDWLYQNMFTLEKQIVRALDAYSDGSTTGKWAKSILGIGPVIAAALLAYIDIEQAPTVGHIWNFAGLNPDAVWLGKEKSVKLIDEMFPGQSKFTVEEAMLVASRIKRKVETFLKFATNESGNITRASLISAASKRPWNASLKSLCWKVGESFVKVSGKERAYYGKMYTLRKQEETERNGRYEYKEQAEKKLATVRIGKDTDAYAWYSKGMLPPAQIHARAKRRAVKIFLSHFHYFLYKEKYGKEPANPYAIAILGHAHMLRPEEAS